MRLALSPGAHWIAENKMQVNQSGVDDHGGWMISHDVHADGSWTFAQGGGPLEL